MSIEYPREPGTRVFFDLTNARRVGVIGYGSWIAEHLIDRIETTGNHLVILHEYEDPFEAGASTPHDHWGYVDFSGLDCLYVFPGRSDPTEEEMQDERILISQITMIPRHKQPKRIVVIGSMASTNTRYGQHKQWVETLLREAESYMCPIVVLRAAAVFGPGQRIESPMLVPSLAREGRQLQLRTPDVLTKFISARDLVAHMTNFADPSYRDHLYCGEPGVIYDIPGTFTATPSQIKDLYLTWESYR